MTRIRRSGALPLPASPLLTRLSRLVRLASGDREALGLAEVNQRRWPARHELVTEHEPVRETRALIAGWAMQHRTLRDGRRQILGFLLPGDLIGADRQAHSLAAAAIAALDAVVTCVAPAAAPGTSLSEAYARSAAMERHHLMAQVTRLGRFDARERLADWLLETRERLALVGLAAADRFPLPVTQEVLADTLGLTSVHVNRTLQAMRRDGLLAWRDGTITFPDRLRLEMMVDYRPARVSLDDEA